MVQKQRLAKLPDIDSLKLLTQSLAMLDAIMSPDWENRYYSFNSKWHDGEMMASMRNGKGDEYFILFNSHGVIIKGFAHESTMSPFNSELPRLWQGVLDSVPSDFQDFLSEPAFSIDEATFCIWRKYSDSYWQVGEIDYPEGEDPDGSEELLSILDGNPEIYQEFAEEYYEEEIPLSAVRHIYEHNPLTKNIVSDLNPDVSIRQLKEDIEEIGYPNRLR